MSIRRQFMVSTYVMHCSTYFSLLYYAARRDLHSFPTRRSSDLCQVKESGPLNLYFRRSYETWLGRGLAPYSAGSARSEEHTSELQSRGHLVCRLLLEKKKDVAITDSKETTVRTAAEELTARQHN